MGDTVGQAYKLGILDIGVTLIGVLNFLAVGDTLLVAPNAFPKFALALVNLLTS